MGATVRAPRGRGAPAADDSEDSDLDDGADAFTIDTDDEVRANGGGTVHGVGMLLLPG